jgi:hypothetical protein
MGKKDANARKQDDLATYLGPMAHGGWVLRPLSEIIQSMQPTSHHFIKVYPPVLNHVLQQR